MKKIIFIALIALCICCCISIVWTSETVRRVDMVYHGGGLDEDHVFPKLGQEAMWIIEQDIYNRLGVDSIERKTPIIDQAFTKKGSNQYCLYTLEKGKNYVSYLCND